VEWPEKVEELLPDEVMKVTITPTSPTKRTITIE
jgi:tRNA A37 threonylcarbamoyladenosine biosynthesis protein TsaE